MKEVKNNVNVFNRDVQANQGYRYTTNAQFSSLVANLRLTKATLANIPSGLKTLIDIGCGDGTYTNELKRLRNGINIEGTDPAEKAIAHAKKNYPDIDFFVSNILIPESLIHRYYGMAILRGVLHHLSDQQEAIKNTLSLADYMLIIEPNGNNPVLKYIEKHSAYHIAHEEQSFSTRQLVTWCLNAGWEISTVQYVGFVPFFSPGFLSRIICFFQPVLGKIPFLSFYLGAQIVIVCKKKDVKY
jgi:2-polyprenyl-3-methyl-5-hydroxy-6-metoxy-1,4-benzoquinol methylase